MPIPLSRCSALIQDDDREMGKFGEIKAKGKIDRNSPSFLLCEFAPRSFAFLLLPRNFLCVWLVNSRLFSPAPQLKRILMSQHSPSLKVPMGLGSLTSLFLMRISRNQFHCFDSTAIISRSVDDSFLSCSCTTSSAPTLADCGGARSSSSLSELGARWVSSRGGGEEEVGHLSHEQCLRPG